MICMIAKFKICNNGSISECILNLSIFSVIPSNPGEKSYFREFIAFIMSSFLIKQNTSGIWVCLFSICIVYGMRNLSCASYKVIHVLSCFCEVIVKAIRYFFWFIWNFSFSQIIINIILNNICLKKYCSLNIICCNQPIIIYILIGYVSNVYKINSRCKYNKLL